MCDQGRRRCRPPEGEPRRRHHTERPLVEQRDRPLTNSGEIEACRMRRFERGDLFCALQRARYVVETFEQRRALVLIEVEVNTQPVRVRDLLRLEVDRELVSPGNRALYRIELSFAEHDRRESRLD